MKRFTSLFSCLLLLGWTTASFAQGLSVTSVTPEDGSTFVNTSLTVTVVFNKDLSDIAVGVHIEGVMQLWPLPESISNLQISGNTLSVDVELAADQSYQIILLGIILRGSDGSDLGKAIRIVGTITTGASLPTGSISGKLTPLYPLATNQGLVAISTPEHEFEPPDRAAEVNADSTYTISHVEPGTYLLAGLQFTSLDPEEHLGEIYPTEITIVEGQTLTGQNIIITTLEVVSSTPEDMAVNVETSITISITFNEPIGYDEEEGEFDIEVDLFPPPLSEGEETFSVDKKTFSVQVLLASNTVYKLFIGYAEGENDKELFEPFILTFSTGASMPTGSISGSITNAAAPAGGGIIAGILNESGVVLSLVIVNEDGTYQISNLDDASYYVLAVTMEDDDNDDANDEEYVAYYGWDGTGDDTPDEVAVSVGGAVTDINMTLGNTVTMKLLSFSPQDGAVNFPTQNAALSFTFNLPMESNISDIEEPFGETFNFGLAPSPDEYPALLFTDYGRTVSMTGTLAEDTYYTAVVIRAFDILGEELSEENFTFVNPTEFGFSTGSSLPTTSVSGTVTLPNPDFDYVIVELLTGSPQTKEDNDAQALGLMDPVTGAYSILVPNGTYWAAAFSDIYTDEGMMELSGFYDPDGDKNADPIVVQDISLTGIDITIEGLGAISGTVTRQDNGDPIAGAHVSLFDAQWNHVNGTGTDSNGNYSMGGLAPGSYYVEANGNMGLDGGGWGRFYRGEHYQESPDREGAVLVAVSGGTETPDISFTLEQAGSGSVSGTVTRQDNGDPIANAQVAVLDSYGNWLGDGRTSFDGSFHIGGLASGSYYVQASGWGDFEWGWQRIYIEEYYIDSPDQAGAALVEVFDGSETSDINFTLEKGGVISGTVTRQDNGEPIANAWIGVYDSEWQHIDGFHTDSDGNYTAGCFASGSYYVEANGQVEVDGGYWQQFYHREYYQESADRDGAGLVSVSVGIETPDINFTLKEGGFISGTVTRQDNSEPIANAQVVVYDSEWNQVYEGRTYFDGNYSIGGLASGSYYVQASGWGDFEWGWQRIYIEEYYIDSPDQAGAALVDVIDGSETSNINFTIEEGGIISGKVTRQDNGEPIGKARVIVFDSEWNRVDHRNTDSDGNYSIGGLWPGSYYVLANGWGGFEGVWQQLYVREYYDDSPDQAGAALVNVVAGSEVPDINFTLEEGGVISGTVTRQDNSAPIADARVNVYNSEWNWVAGQRTDSDGNYSIGGLASDSYYVQANGQVLVEGVWQKLYVGEYYDDSPDRAGAALVNVVAGSEVPDINFTLEDGGIISGMVIRQDNEAAIAGAQVIVYDRGWNWVNDRRTDSEGNYSIGGLWSGSYYVQASGWGEFEGEWQSLYIGEYYDDSPDREGAALIEVIAGSETAVIGFTLEEGGIISGTVTRQDNGEPIANAHVGIFDSEWNGISGTGTDSNDNYSMGGLAPGSYYVTAHGNVGLDGGGWGSFYRSEHYQESPDAEGALLVAVSVGIETPDINFTLEQDGSGSVSGTVNRQDNGEPIEHAQVVVLDSYGSCMGEGRTAPDGRYHIGGLASGSYYVQASGWGDFEGGWQRIYIEEYYVDSPDMAGAALVEVIDGSETSDINFTLEGGGVISGMMIRQDNGAAIAGAQVIVYDSDWEYVNEQRTDKTGNYSIGGLAAGSYYVQASGWGEFEGEWQSLYIEEYYVDSPDRAGAALIEVSAGIETPNIGFTLEEGGAISGTVTCQDNGDPIANAHVSIFDSEWNGISGTATDPNGNYSMGGLAPGSYYVVANGNVNLDGGGWGKFYRGEHYQESPDPEGAVLVAVSGGIETADISFTLEQDGSGSVSGTVNRQDNGEPIEHAQVSVLDSYGNGLGDGGRTAQDGRYHIGGLASGSYYVQASGWGDFEEGWQQLYVEEYYVDSPDMAGAALVEVIDGSEVPDVDFTLEERSIWTVNPADYANTMTMTAQLVINDIASTDATDIVGVFVGEECRGSGNPEYFLPKDYYVVNLTIYSNTYGEKITFKAFDNSACKVYDVTADTAVTFVPDANYGNADFPIILRNTRTIVKPLNKGWTWFSVNVYDEDMTLGNVLSSLASVDGDLIKNQYGFSTFYEGFGWFGDLDSLYREEMYMIKLAEADILEFSGKDCEITPIPLNEGWTWIGYLPQTPITIENALQSLKPTGYELIKNQIGFSTFYEGYGWFGDLNDLKPHDGYKIKMGSADTLLYPEAGGTAKLALGQNEQPQDIPRKWSITPSDYVNTMTMTAQVLIDGEALESEDYLVGVFAGEECRGVGKPTYFPPNETYVVTLTVYSNEDDENLTFKAISSAGEIIAIKSTCEFQSDNNIGNAKNPIILIGSVAGIDETSGLPREFALYNNYPNPFNPETVIKFQLPKTAFITLKIYNITGQLIKTLVSEDFPAGIYHVTWDGTSTYGQQVSSGVYLYKIKAGNFTAIKKLMFLK